MTAGPALSPEEVERVARIDALAIGGGEDAVAGLTAMLGDPSWTVRRAVVSALASIGDVAVDALCAIVRDQRQDETRLAAAVDALVASTGGSVLECVTALADAEHPPVAADSAQVLGRRRAAAALPVLVRLTRHPDDNVAVAAIEALGRLGGRAAIEALVDTVRGGSFFRSFPALDVLGRSGDPRAVEPLVAVLSNPFLAPEAARALGRTGERGAVAPLAGLLVHASDAMVRVAAVALIELQARRAARLGEGDAIIAAVRRSTAPATARRLGQALTGADATEQIAIAWLLGIVGGADAIAALSRLLDAESPVAQAAAQALAEVAGTAVDEMIVALDQGDSARRLVLLPMIRRASAVPVVIRCLADEDAAVRAAACDALARIGSPGAVPAIFRLLADGNPRVVQAAIAAIQALGGSDAERLALEAGRSPWPTVRRAALRILAYYGWPSGLPILADAVRDDDPRIAEAAVHGLPFLQDPRALELLLEIARDPSSRLRAACARALGQCRGDLRVTAALLRGLGDPDPWVRYYACQSLGRLGIETATTAIARLVDDPAGQVRVAAIEALSHLRSEIAFEALRAAGRSPDADVQRAALVGLGISRQPEAAPILVAAIGSADAATRLVAVSALADFDEAAEVLRALGRAAVDPDGAVRNAAIGFLAARRGEGATALLVDLLIRGGDVERVVAALALPIEGRAASLASALVHADDELAPLLVSALARMRGPDAEHTLRGALTLPNPAARKAVASAVAAQATPDAFAALQRVAAADPDPEVRRIAALLLSN